MSTLYNSSAKHRGRRETESSDQPSRSRASSSTAHRVSKQSSRILEDSTTPRNSRPNSPALFLQRNRTVDNSRPTDSIMISPKSSNASIKSEQATSNPCDGDKTPTPVSPTKPNSAKLSRFVESARGSVGAVGFGIDNITNIVSENQNSASDGAPPTARKTSETQAGGSSPTKLKSKSSGLSQASVSKMHPRVSNPSEEDLLLRKDSGSSSTKSAQGEQSAESPEKYGYQPPNTATPTMSPPQSPLMQYSNYGVPPMTQHQYAHLPGMMPGPSFPGNYYPTPFTPPPSQPAPIPEPARSLSPSSEEDRQLLLEKVSGVLPDINRLLNQYQEAQGQLTAKDLLMRQTELQRNEESSRLRFELDVKKEEYEKLIEGLVGENYRFKLEAEDDAKTIASLQHAVKGHQKIKEEIEAIRPKYAEIAATADAARLAKEQILSDKLKLENGLEDMKKRRTADQDFHKRAVAELKVSHREQMDSKEREHSRAASEQKTVLSKVQLELANLITKHSQQKKDLEGSRGALAVLEQKQAAKMKEHEAALEEAAAQHSQKLASQLQSLTSKHEENVKAIHETHDRAIKQLREAHEKGIRDAITENEAKITTLTQEHQTQIEKMEGELEKGKGALGKLQTQHDELGSKHAELAGGLMSWKQRHEAWQSENDKFNRLLETLGQTMGSKSDQS